MTIKTMLRAAGVFIATGVVAPAFGLIVTPLVVNITPGNSAFADIHLLNEDKDHKVYVRVTAQRLLNPGAAHPKWETLREDPFAFGLSTSRNNVVMQPNSRRVVRVTSLQKAGQHDRVYRITIVPLFGNIEAPRPRAHEVVHQINLHVGYRVWVFVRPLVTKRSVSMKQTGKRFVVKNTGNTTVLLHDGIQCDKTGKQCQALPSKRLFSGEIWQETLPYDTKPQYAY